MNAQTHVIERYSEAAKSKAPELCCPVDYNPALLALLPQEIIDKDYGCGDSSSYVQPGDTVLDLGSGSGKICYMAAQLVGENGKVIGVDMNDDMLGLARKYQSEMAAKLGNDRVEFRKGYIQDLAIDLDALEKYLQQNKLTSLNDYHALQEWQDTQRNNQPLVADASVDVVVSNCVLNLVPDHQKRQLIREIFRVLRPGGRIAIADIVSDETIPEAMKQDPVLWSGCIAGAFVENEFLKVATEAGFLGARYDKWSAEPWRIVNGIEFRSVTLTAVKGQSRECLDYGHAVIYLGPYPEIHDDEGHIYLRGERMAVCERTYRLLTETPLYRDDFIGIPPSVESEPKSWCAPPGTIRKASETKGAAHVGNECCSPVNCC